VYFIVYVSCNIRLRDRPICMLSRVVSRTSCIVSNQDDDEMRSDTYH